jgi:hypothetical protein
MPHFLAKIHCSHWDPNGFQGGCGEVRMGSMRDKLLVAYQSGLTIREHLAKRDPANTGWQRDLSVSNVKIGDVLVAQGDGLGGGVPGGSGDRRRPGEARSGENAVANRCGRILRQAWES